MFNLFKKRAKKPEAVAAQPVVPDTIKVVDSYGRPMEIARSEWRDKMLLPALRQHWDEPDELYRLIVQALDDGMVADVREASARLVQIDPMIERGHAIDAIVRLKLDDTRGAEASLRAAMLAIGETGTLLTNLAKVQYQAGDETKALQTLERGLSLDPNQENGLGWWCALVQERSGETGVDEELQRLAAWEGSWRPRLLLGQRALQRGDAPVAIEHFRHVLAVNPDGADVLMIVGGALGQAGLLGEALQLIVPVFDVERHDPRAAFNLLQIYLQLNDSASGLALLERLFALKQPAHAQTLQHFASAFDALVREPAQPLDTAPQVELRQLDLPPWLLAMRDMGWAAPDMRDRTVRVLLLPLSATGDAGDSEARKGREDERGRISRALPLFLLEQAVFRSELAPTAIIPVVGGGGLVLFGQPWSDDELRRFGEGYDYVVEGEVSEGADGFTVAWRAHPLADMSVCLTLERTFAADDFGEAALHLAETMLDALARKSATVVQPRGQYYAPPAEYATQYLSALAQTLVLTLLNGPGDREKLFGERNIYNWMQNLALASPDNEAAQIMYFTALAKGRRAGSPIVDEFELPATERIRSLANDGRYAARMAPLLAATFPDNIEMRRLAAAQARPDDPSYEAWRAKLGVSLSAPVDGA
jgi:tetratricopeptide (TPR) repeat protein